MGIIDTLLNMEKSGMVIGNISDKNIQIVFETIPSAMALVNVDGKFIYVNTRGIKLFGIDCTGFDMDTYVSKVKVLKLDGKPFSLEEMPISHTLKSGQVIRNVGMLIGNVEGMYCLVDVSFFSII